MLFDRLSEYYWINMLLHLDTSLHSLSAGWVANISRIFSGSTEICQIKCCQIDGCTKSLTTLIDCFFMNENIDIIWIV